MKVTFIYPDFLSLDTSYTGAFNEGVGSLSAVLKNAGHETSLIHVTQSSYAKKDFLLDISNASPDLIGFSSTTITFSFVKKVLGWIEEEGIDTPTICGGVHAIVASEDAIATPRMDMVCIGEGEETLVELADRMERGETSRDLPGLWYKKADGTIVRSAPRPLIKDLDTLPDPDRELFNLETCSCERHGIGVFMVSRGCPYDCTYCVNHTIKNLFGSKHFVRYRSVDSVIGQIKKMTERYPFIKSLFFNDDILFLNLKWSEEFSKRYVKEINLPFECNVHPRLLDEKRATLLRKSNCIAVRIGIESGNDHIRTQVLKRILKPDELEAGLNVCHAHGFATASYNMVGLPFETARNILETIKLNVRLKIGETQVTIFYPFPGTEIYEICRSNGMLPSETRELDDYFTDSSLNLPTITRDQVRFFRYNFQRLVAAYREIQKLPEPWQSITERSLDGLVTRPEVASLTNAARTVYKRGQALKWLRETRKKSKAQSEAYRVVKRHKTSQQTESQ